MWRLSCPVEVSETCADTKTELIVTEGAIRSVYKRECSDGIKQEGILPQVVNADLACMPVGASGEVEQDTTRWALAEEPAGRLETLINPMLHLQPEPAENEQIQGAHRTVALEQEQCASHERVAVDSEALKLAKENAELLATLDVAVESELA